MDLSLDEKPISWKQSIFDAFSKWRLALQNVNHRNIPVSILRVRFLNTTIFSVYAEKCYLPPIFQCYSFSLLYYPYSHFWGRTRMHVQRRVRR